MSRNDLVVYTTVFGTTDQLKAPRCSSAARFVAFTDRPVEVSGWQVVVMPASPAPKRACRAAKQLSHVVFPDAQATLWVDASYELLVDPMELLSRFDGELWGFSHHRRRRIKDEAEAIIKSGKGRAQDIRAQLAFYQSQGWDTDRNPQQAITNGGFLLRRHTDRVQRFNLLWNNEVQTRSLRDQMSIDYCAHRSGVRIQHFPGTVPNNEFARFHYINKPTNDF